MQDNMPLKQLLEEQRKNHICRFNDGECKCECFIAGQLFTIEHIKKMIEETLVPDKIIASSNPRWVYNQAKKDIINNLEVK